MENWYYSINGQQYGPYPESVMMEFIRSGTISAETYVWHSGLPDWILLKNSSLGPLVNQPNSAGMNGGMNMGGGYPGNQPGQNPQYGPNNGYSGYKNDQGNYAQPGQNVYIQNNYQAPSGGFYGIPTRSIVGCIFLSIVTCGIYALIWLYNIAKDVNMMCSEKRLPQGMDPIMVIFLGIVTCGIYYLIFWYQTGKKLSQLSSNGSVSDNAVLLCIMGLFLPVVSMCIIQDEINTLVTIG